MMNDDFEMTFDMIVMKTVVVGGAAAVVVAMMKLRNWSSKDLVAMAVSVCQFSISFRIHLQDCFGIEMTRRVPGSVMVPNTMAKERSSAILTNVMDCPTPIYSNRKKNPSIR